MGTTGLIMRQIEFSFQSEHFLLLSLYKDLVDKKEITLDLKNTLECKHREKHGKILRKILKIVPNFLKVRMFLSKWVSYSTILTKTFSFRESWGFFCCLFSKFSYDFC